MNVIGTIRLFHGEIQLCKFNYFSKEDRRVMIRRWKESYIEKWEECHLLISPTIMLHELNRIKVPDNGVIAPSHRAIVKQKEVPVEKIVRPPAIYDNIQSYRYE